MEVPVEPLSGREREERAILDFCSWTVFSLDFAKAHFGEDGPVMLGRHWGSIEKLGWKSMRDQKLSPSKFLAGTYKYNWEPMGFKATIYEEIPDVKASMLIKLNPLADFIREYMAGIGTLTEEDAWKFLCACFEWVKDYGYGFEAKKTREGYKLTIIRKKK